MDLYDDGKARLKAALDDLNADTQDMEVVINAFVNHKLIVMTEEDYYNLLALAEGA